MGIANTASWKIPHQLDAQLTLSKSQKPVKIEPWSRDKKAAGSRAILAVPSKLWHIRITSKFMR
jgi:hypothetical protein